MMDRLGRERLLQMLLAGTPDRVIEPLTMMSADDMRDCGELREDLAMLAHAVPAKAPPSKLRERLLATKPRPLGPTRPVLVVLDMINDYLREGGPLEVPRARDIVPAVKRCIEEARRDGVPVIFVCDSHPADDVEFEDWPRHAIEGTGGDEVWPELAPAPGDRVIKKRTYSAFKGSKFGEVLDELGADKIILTGCATEVGIFATAKDALEEGFVVTVPPECQAGASVLTEQATMMTLGALPPFEPRYRRRKR